MSRANIAAIRQDASGRVAPARVEPGRTGSDDALEPGPQIGVDAGYQTVQEIRGKRLPCLIQQVGCAGCLNGQIRSNKEPPKPLGSQRSALISAELLRRTRSGVKVKIQD
jgi:hypothetical protein